MLSLGWSWKDSLLTANPLAARKVSWKRRSWSCLLSLQTSVQFRANPLHHVSFSIGFYSTTYQSVQTALVINTSTPRRTRAWRTPTDTRPPLATSSQAPHAHQSSHAPRVYQYVQELSGIQSTLYSPLPADDIPLPSFGDVPDSYLESHGYSHRTLLCVQHALDVSVSGQQFVDNLSGRGLPITEAQWLWFIITGDSDF